MGGRQHDQKQWPPGGQPGGEETISGGFNSPTSLPVGIDSRDRSPLRQQVDEAIAANGAGTKITMQDLTVLAPQNDPFRIDRPSAHRDGEWLAVHTVKGGEIHLVQPEGRLQARMLGTLARHEPEHRSDRVRPRGAPKCGTR
jgi:hypothetical protein